MSKKEFIVAKYENDELIEKIIELKDQLKKCNITKQSSKRHYLRNNLNKVVRCKGYLVRQNKYNDRFIIINILSADDGKFVSDHIHLDLKIDEFNYVENEIQENSLVYFKGYVKEYERKNESVDYEVQVIEKPIWISSLYYNDDWNPNEYFDEEPDIETIFNFLYKKEKVYLYNLVQNLRKEINRFTANDFGVDYVYTYLMNTYLLNLASHEMFCNSINGLQLTRKGLINLIYLLSSIIMDLSTLECTTIEKILGLVTYECNVVQGVCKYTKFKETDFVNFCETNLNINDLKTIKYLWEEVLLRKKDFGSNSNPYNISMKAIITDAYKVLNKFIK